MKDYYAILGVVPSAEDVVIRAAWKALAQRYHPDRFTGDVAKANARIVEINEAYNILSDAVQRKAYDKSRMGKEGDFGDWIHEEEADQATNSFDPFEQDWALAVGFYPDLVNINNRLSKISQLLAFNYRASLLEHKTFEKREKLAEVAEDSFLQSYFGSNSTIVAFAKELIFEGNKTAAKALNDYIRVLGSDISPYVVIDKICKDFNIETKEMRQHRWRETLAEKQIADVAPVTSSPSQAGNWNWLYASCWIAAAFMLLAVIGYFGDKKNEARLPSQADQIATISSVATPVDGPTQPAAKPDSLCFEWGDFSGADLARVTANLLALQLGDKLSQRQIEYNIGYWVYIPPVNDRATMAQIIAQLKAAGVEYFVVPEAGPWLNAISLGVFKTQETARYFFDDLHARGVRSVQIGERASKLKATIFVLNGLDAATGDSLAEIQKSFAGSELKKIPCVQVFPNSTHVR